MRTALKYGYDYALNLLISYVKNKQPRTFLPNCTGARSMARIASLAIEGLPINSNVEFIETKFGFDLYMKMFGNSDYNNDSPINLDGIL